jgi:hypothetical protein
MWSAGFYLTCYLACCGYYGTWIKLNWIEYLLFLHSCFQVAAYLSVQYDYSYSVCEMFTVYSTVHKGFRQPNDSLPVVIFIVGVHSLLRVSSNYKIKPPFVTTSITCFISCFYYHYMFRPSQEAIFRWLLVNTKKISIRLYRLTTTEGGRMHLMLKRHLLWHLLSIIIFNFLIYIIISIFIFILF